MITDSMQQFDQPLPPVAAPVIGSVPAFAELDGAEPGVVSVEKAGLPFLMFCVFTFILVGRPQDYFPQLAPFRIALVSTALTCVVTLFGTRKARAVSPFSTTESKLYFALFAAMCAGLPFSVYRRDSFNFVVFQYAMNLIFFVLFLIHVDTLAKYKRFVFVLLCSSLAFSVYQLRSGELLYGSGRFAAASEVFDPNDVAFVEVCLMSFALFTVLAGYRLATRLAAMIAIMLGSLMALYTGSRGGLLGLGTLFLLFLALRVPRVGKSLKILLLIAVIAAAAANAARIDIDRYRTLGSLGDDYNFDEFGRTDLWQRGLQLFAASPITGVGVDGFPAAIGIMRDQEGRIPYWQAAHSSYIQMLAETGLIGFVPFLLLIVRSLWTFNTFRRSTAAELETDAAVVPVMLLAGFAALLVSAAFLSEAYSLFFTISFAIAAALNAGLLGSAAPPAVDDSALESMVVEP